jgi:hypothetical protein
MTAAAHGGSYLAGCTQLLYEEEEQRAEPVKGKGGREPGSLLMRRNAIVDSKGG